MTAAEKRFAVSIIEGGCSEGWPAARIDKALADQLPQLNEQEISVCWASATSALAKKRKQTG